MSSTAKAGTVTEQPDHLVPIPGTEWQLWRWVALRSAGFPVSTLLSLAAAQTADKVDRLLGQEEAIDAAQQQAIATLHRDLEQASGERRLALLKAARSLFVGKTPSLVAAEAESATALDQLRDARAAAQQSRVELQPCFSVESARCWATLVEFAGTPGFQEAVLWQNPQAYRDSIQWLFRHPAEDNKRARQKRQLIASYVQRYCAKNDTIGFFGPVGWATIAPCGETVSFCPGNGILARRQVYFEPWCIEALARKLSAEELRPWLAPRLLPFHYLEEDRLCQPSAETWIAAGQWPRLFQQPIHLSAGQLALLQFCDGQRSAREIATQLLRDPTAGFATEDHVFRMLQFFCDFAVMQWGLEAAMELYPERGLRRQLERIEDEALRAPRLNALGELEARRGALASAAGRVEELQNAMAQLEATFERITDCPAQRSQGQMYASRTLIYEDCVRDVEVTLDPKLLSRLAPLELVLESARWFTYQIAKCYEAALRQIYRSLSQERGTRAVDLAQYCTRTASIFQDSWEPLAEVQEDLQKRWAGILELPADAHRAEFAFAELAPRVREAFDAPHAGWPLARYCSPDLMIAAKDPQAVRQGEFGLVLGEVHLTNTLGASCFLNNHPQPDRLRAARANDLREALVIPAPSQRFNVQRTTFQLIAPQDLVFEFERTVTPETGHARLRIGQLLVEETEDGLQVRSRDGQIGLGALSFFGQTIANHCNSFPPLLASSRHTPRVTVDGVVLARERWQFSPKEIFSKDARELETCYFDLRRLKKAHGLPRFLFVRLPQERKPYYLDLESPIFVELFARLVRKTVAGGSAEAEISLTEMLPTLEEAWLTDATGQRYVSELRLVCLDPKPWRSAPAPGPSKRNRV